MSRPPFVVSGYSIAELLFCVSNGNLHMLHRECRVMIRVAALLLCCGPLMAQYDPMAPEPVAKLRGSLLLHGGGPVSREVRETLVELAGGAKAKIVVVIAADGDGQIAEWKAMEPGSIEVVELTSLTGAPEAAILASLIEATGVWFESTYAAGVETDDRKPSIKTAIRAVIDRGGVVGGTSSGAAWLVGFCGPMVRSRWGSLFCRERSSPCLSGRKLHRIACFSSWPPIPTAWASEFLRRRCCCSAGEVCR